MQAVTGKTPSTQQCDNYEPGEICFYKPADINENFCFIEQAKEKVSAKGASCAPILPINSILVSCIGNIGKCSIISKVGICNQQINAILPNSHLNMLLLLYFLRSEEMKQQEIEHSSATTISILNKSTFVSLLIPLPPEREQTRITDCINSYFSRLDVIAESRQRYTRILSEKPTSLRQQLIQAAIQGQLVPQNPNDEPASVLLERIAQERTAKLGSKSAKSMSRIERRGSKTYELFPDGSEKDISEDIPFEIPCSWEWARGKSIFDETKNRVPETDFSYIDIDAIDNKRHIIKSGKPTKKEEAPSRARRILESGDVLFSLVRPYLENIALVGKQHASSIASTGFYVVRTKVLLPDFTYSLFLSPYVIHGLNSFMKGDNSPSIRSENIEDFLYPIPPLPEQQRIVRALYKILSYIAL